MFYDTLGRKLTGLRSCSLVRFAGLQRRPFLKLRLHLFTTIKQTFHRARPWILVVSVEHTFDRADNDVKRHTTIAPAFDHRPVDRAKQKMFSPPADERIFDLGEVIVVV